MKIQYFIFTTLAGCFALVCLFPAQINAEETPSKPDESETLPKTAPHSATIVGAPFLKPGEQAVFRILDSNNMPLSNISVFVNGLENHSQENGRLTIQVPAQTLVLSLTSQGKKEFARLTYEKSASGILAKKPCLGIAETLWNQKSVNYPQILFNSTTAQPGGTLIILGRNLATDKTETAVFINGHRTEITATSSLSLVVSVPADLESGSAQELYINQGKLSSNTSEIDICQPEIKIPPEQKKQNNDDESNPEPLEISIQGSRLPCLLHVTNESNERVSLWLPDQQPMGKERYFVSPGGNNNSIELKLKRKSGDLVRIAAQLKPELPWDNDDPANKYLSGVEKDLLRGRIMRLFRVLLSAQTELEKLRKQGDTDNEKQASAVPALALKEARLQNMLRGLKCVYNGIGGSSDGYRRAVDEAASGAFLRLDERSQPVEVEPGSKLSLSVFTQPESSLPERDALQSTARNRPLRLIEPSIKLLQPVETGAPPPRATEPEPNPENDDDDEIPVDPNSVKLRNSLPEMLPTVPKLPLPEKAENQANGTAVASPAKVETKPNTAQTEKKVPESKASTKAAASAKAAKNKASLKAKEATKTQKAKSTKKRKKRQH